MQKYIRIIYVYDALCGWCYGFSKVIHAFYESHGSIFPFEVLSGGMMTGERVGSINDIAPFIKSAYKTVEDTTGIKFGEPYLKHLEEGTMILNSEKPAIALSVFKSYLPEKAVAFTHDLQDAIYFEGQDPNENELYRYLAVNFGIDPDDFEVKLQEESFKTAAFYEFSLAKQIQVTGFPAVLVQSGETGFYLIAKGYTDLDTLELRLQNVLSEIQAS
ncbi:DsbA family protein [Daejeonella lutea]|uniref:DSBA-like thioredoxin domain-containing protein n=1 Tax=Daejeonella lutea TaxID=572036 RepID=A0A1T5AGU8_9SPHI|nr:DsbA family protein [Daejeonella lutea]SKB34232.1 putative protein-disulfide isomerase [Daejeonella lutea]